MMFLPDGRVLIMDKDVYQKTLEQSIVLDLFEHSQPAEQDPALDEVHISMQANMRIKQDNRKQSQANQKPRVSESGNNLNQNDSMIVSNLVDISLITSELSSPRDFLQLLNQQDFSDITLMVEGKPIYCHQIVLASRSGYFEAQFSHDFSERDTRISTYNDVPYDFMIMFLRHIYSDTVKVESKYIYDLLSVSNLLTIIAG